MGYVDILRLLVTLVLTVFVAFIIAPIAPWVLWIAVFTNFYTVTLELLKFYLGIKEMHSDRQKSLVILSE